MANAVFTAKVDPTYDDLPEERYHFPRSYLRAAESAIGDWIVYYEPRRGGGRLSYFATARVTRIESDSRLPDHFYAFVTDYLGFDRAVPFLENGQYYEAGLRGPDNAVNAGTFQRSVRNISAQEYDLILRAGFTRILGDLSARNMHSPNPPGFYDEPTPFEYDRPIIERVIARPFRDAAFSNIVKSAYGDTCAVTGLKIINGGGRSEVQAAHIRPVASAGPDSVRNGIALCGTAHWIFDRGLLSIDDDLRLLVAKDKVPDSVRRLLNPDGVLARPASSDLMPHRQFLKFHRENVFKG